MFQQMHGQKFFGCLTYSGTRPIELGTLIQWKSQTYLFGENSYDQYGFKTNIFKDETWSEFITFLSRPELQRAIVIPYEVQYISLNINGIF